MKATGHVMVVTQSTPLSQPATVTGLRDRDWSTINEELASMLAPLHVELANNIAPPCEAGVEFAAVEFASLITAHLEHHGTLQRCKPSSTNCQPHRNCAIVHLTKCLAKPQEQFPETVSLREKPILKRCSHIQQGGESRETTITTKIREETREHLQK